MFKDIEIEWKGQTEVLKIQDWTEFFITFQSILSFELKLT